MEDIKEKRIAKRYSVQYGAIVYLKRKPHFFSRRSKYIQLGPVFDISLQGMSIHYFYDNGIPEISSDLAISTSSGKIIIDNVRFETIYDEEIAKMPDGKVIRKRAMRLVELSGYQSAWLACLIHNLKSRQIELPYKTDPEDKPLILKDIS